MKKTENECVSCGLPCLGANCVFQNVTRYYCDECGEETTLYKFDGEELCIDCIKNRLETVDGSE